MYHITYPTSDKSACTGNPEGNQKGQDTPAPHHLMLGGWSKSTKTLPKILRPFQLKDALAIDYAASHGKADSSYLQYECQSAYKCFIMVIPAAKDEELILACTDPP